MRWSLLAHRVILRSAAICPVLGDAVMTRATLGHTGRDVTSTPANMAIYAAIIAAALMRVAAPLLPTLYYPALLVAAACWLLAFGIFLLIYGPMLFRAKTGA